MQQRVKAHFLNKSPNYLVSKEEDDDDEECSPSYVHSSFRESNIKLEKRLCSPNTASTYAGNEPSKRNVTQKAAS